MGIAAFDLFDIKDYIDIVLDLKPTDPVSAKLETLGFESLYFLHNLGTFTCVIIGYTLVVILWFLLYPFAKLSFWIKQKRDQLGDKLFWNQWLIVITQSFVIVVLVAAIHFKYSQYFASYGINTQTIFCIATTCLYLYLPTMAFFMLMKKFAMRREGFHAT